MSAPYETEAVARSAIANTASGKSKPAASELAATSPAATTGGAPTRDRLGRPLLDLRISVIDACNYRCGYCMPAEQTYSFFRSDELLDFAEIERLARIFGELGAIHLRITGGEPLLRKNLPDLIERLAFAPGVEDLALTTNGELLAENAERLKAAGLRRITVSLDSLDPDRFRELSGGRGSLTRVLAGIDAALAAGLRPLKINSVVKKGCNDRPADVARLVAFARERDITVRFIEYMDAGNRNGWRPDQVVTSADLFETILDQQRVTGGPELIAEPYESYGETARRYRFADGRGGVGFISSVSSPFCGGCTRARLSADGRLYLCLFARDGLDLRALLRSGAPDAAVMDAIARVWRARDDRYSEERFRNAEKSSEGAEKVEMFRVGG